MGFLQVGTIDKIQVTIYTKKVEATRIFYPNRLHFFDFMLLLL